MLFCTFVNKRPATLTKARISLVAFEVAAGYRSAYGFKNAGKRLMILAPTTTSIVNCLLRAQ